MASRVHIITKEKKILIKIPVIEPDNLHPTIARPTGAMGTLPASSSQVSVAWIPPTATDDTSTPTITSDFQPGSLFSYGSTTVTYTATDDVGQTDVCSFVVTVAGSYKLYLL